MKLLDPRPEAELAPSELAILRERAELALDASAARVELYFCAVRVLFASTFAVRALFIEHGKPGVDFTVLVVASGYSACVWALAGRGQLRRFHGDVSVVLDSLLAMYALYAANMDPARPTYEGLFRMPDIGIPALIAATSAVRFSLRNAALAGAVNLGVVVILAALDRHVMRERAAYSWEEVSVVCITVLVMAAFASLVAWRSRRILLDQVRSELARERAKRNLQIVLRDSHDARGTLAGATLSAELLARGLGSQTTPENRALLESLFHDLEALRDQVQVVREKSFAELAHIEGPQRVEIGPVVEQAVREARRRFPATSFTADVDSGVARFVGGNGGLRRALLNLLANSAEGSAEGAAGSVHVRLEAAAEGLALVIEDDGPGLPAATMNGEVGFTTKAQGAGLGVALVRAMAAASSGALEPQNVAPRGCRMVLRLAAAADAPTRRGPVA